LLGAEVDVAVADIESNFKFGVHCLKAVDVARQLAFGEGVAGRDPQHRLFTFTQLRESRFDLIECLAETSGYAPGVICQHGPSAMTLKEPQSQAPLQHLDLIADRGLRGPQLMSRRSERTAARDRFERPDCEQWGMIPRHGS